MMEDWQKYYLAGIWDADGSFGVSKKKNWNQFSGRSKLWTRYQPFASINLCDPKAEIIGAMIESNFGFKCVFTARRPNNPKWKVAYRWMLSSQRACNFAKLLEPYLVIKKERAQILADWPTKRNGLSGDYRMELTTAQDELYERIKVLNKRGAG
jgi:hypothetical protein